jgi:hypothetical protein
MVVPDKQSRLVLVPHLSRRGRPHVNNQSNRRFRDLAAQLSLSVWRLLSLRVHQQASFFSEQL